MEKGSSDSFFNQLTAMLNAAGTPAAILDEQFFVVWISKTCTTGLPSFSIPDGARLLLNAYDPETVKSEIAREGAFVVTTAYSLFSGHPFVICALPDKSGRYLLQPNAEQTEGDAMRPAGISRTLSSFANQYRAPLSIIFSTLDSAAHACSTDATEGERRNHLEYLETINRNAFLLLRNCEWISDYTRLSYGLAPVKLQRIDLFFYLRELFSAAAEMIEPSGIPLSYNIPKGRLLVACDIEKIAAVLRNLLSNSCHFTRPDNQIMAKAYYRNGWATISVADRGLGIPADIQPHIFEPYYSYSHEGQPFAGNGLGLTIAHDALAAIGGTIALTSLSGKGTTVVLRFPVSDDNTVPPAVFCDAADYVADRFSPLRVALSDSISPAFYSRLSEK